MGRAVIVTGASSGIGLGIAVAFLAAGDHVVLVGRHKAKLLAVLQAEVNKDDGLSGTAFLLEKDLSTVEGCQECVEEGVAAMAGRLDILVNNAGAARLGSSIEATSLSDWQFHLDTNLRSAFLVTQAAIPHLAKRGGGAIINISSIAGPRPFPNCMAYCVSKAGLDMLTKCCALELAPRGIRVNAINPGTIQTGFHEAAGMSAEGARAFYEDAAGVHPIGRVGHPQDVAQLAMFLASNETAGFLTGQTILLDGARTLVMPSGAGLTDDR